MEMFLKYFIISRCIRSSLAGSSFVFLLVWPRLHALLSGQHLFRESRNVGQILKTVVANLQR